MCMWAKGTSHNYTRLGPDRVKHRHLQARQAPRAAVLLGVWVMPSSCAAEPCGHPCPMASFTTRVRCVAGRLWHDCNRNQGVCARTCMQQRDAGPRLVCGVGRGPHAFFTAGSGTRGARGLVGRCQLDLQAWGQRLPLVEGRRRSDSRRGAWLLVEWPLGGAGATSGRASRLDAPLARGCWLGPRRARPLKRGSSRSQGGCGPLCGASLTGSGRAASRA